MEIEEWASGVPCAVTVTDAEGRITFMNAASHAVNDKYECTPGQTPVGHLLGEYHGTRAMAVINRLLTEGGTNIYGIVRKGQRKQVYQTAWTRPDGTIGGVVEITFALPSDMPVYTRG